MKLIGSQKVQKQNLVKRVEEIDIVAESRLLDIREWEERISLEKQLEDINIMEELHWKQRAKNQWLLKGDANTQYFHQFANGRRRNNTIFYLEDNGVEFRGQQNIIQHVVDYYKKLFGHSEESSLQLGTDFWPSSLQVSAGE